RAAGTRAAAAQPAARAAERRTALRRVDIFPHHLVLRRHLEDGAVGPGANERVAVGEPLGAGNERGVEVGLLRRRIAPDGLVRPTRLPLGGLVFALAVDGQDDLVHRRVRPPGAPHAVVEDEEVAFAWQPLGDPVGVVLAEQLLVLDGAGAV